MSVYLVAQLRIHDREEYARYEEKFMEVFNKYDGELLSVDEAPEVLEGEWAATRSVLIRFPTAQAAKAWMFSEEYRAIAKHRLAASTANSFLVQGLTPET